jgi:hypothetical protein
MCVLILCSFVPLHNIAALRSFFSLTLAPFSLSSLELCGVIRLQVEKDIKK